MNPPDPSATEAPAQSDAISRADFEQFLHEITHEIRNRLNIIALEAADMADQVGSPQIAGRLQKRVQETSVFLRKMRESLAPDDATADPVPLADFVHRMREGQDR